MLLNWWSIKCPFSDSAHTSYLVDERTSSLHYILRDFYVYFGRNVRHYNDLMMILWCFRCI
jgi:hypothetical protein